jgi:hypothetical protein
LFIVARCIADFSLGKCFGFLCYRRGFPTPKFGKKFSGFSHIVYRFPSLPWAAASQIYTGLFRVSLWPVLREVAVPVLQLLLFSMQADFSLCIF